jgi:LPXTG-motif cell wall-anchored protein
MNPTYRHSDVRRGLLVLVVVTFTLALLIGWATRPAHAQTATTMPPIAVGDGGRPVLPTCFRNISPTIDNPPAYSSHVVTRGGNRNEVVVFTSARPVVVIVVYAADGTTLERAFNPAVLTGESPPVNVAEHGHIVAQTVCKQEADLTSIFPSTSSTVPFVPTTAVTSVPSTTTPPPGSSAQPTTPATTVPATTVVTSTTVARSTSTGVLDTTFILPSTGGGHHGSLPWLALGSLAGGGALLFAARRSGDRVRS